MCPRCGILIVFSPTSMSLYHLGMGLLVLLLSYFWSRVARLSICYPHVLVLAVWVMTLSLSSLGARRRWCCLTEQSIIGGILSFILGLIPVLILDGNVM